MNWWYLRYPVFHWIVIFSRIYFQLVWHGIFLPYNAFYETLKDVENLKNVSLYFSVPYISHTFLNNKAPFNGLTIVYPFHCFFQIIKYSVHMDIIRFNIYFIRNLYSFFSGEIYKLYGKIYSGLYGSNIPSDEITNGVSERILRYFIYHFYLVISGAVIARRGKAVPITFVGIFMPYLKFLWRIF